MRQPLASLIAALAAPLLALASAGADQQYVREVPPEEIHADTPSEGEHLRFVARYMGTVQMDLQLFEVPLRLVVNDPAVTRALLDFHPKLDNLLIEGRVTAVERGGSALRGTFEVLKAQAAPDDFQLYRQRLHIFLQQKDATGKPFLRVAEKCYRLFAAFGDARQASLASEAVRRAYDLEVKKPNYAAAEDHLAYLAELHRRVPLREAIAPIVVLLSSRFPGHPGVRARLVEFGYKESNGQWLSQDDFKRREGFIRAGDRWVKRSSHEMQVVVETLQQENLTNLILRARTEREYGVVSKRGEVAIGMNRGEVATATGFADRVRRERVRDLEVDQWEYSDRRIYFINGEVLLVWQPDETGKAPASIADAVRQSLHGQPEGAAEKGAKPERAEKARD